MNIAIWLYRLGEGGAERVVTDLASEFASKGHEVSLLVHSENNPYGRELHENVNLISLENIFSRYLKPRTFFCLFSLIKFLKNKKPDVVFTTGVTHSVILIFVAWLFRIKSKVIIRETNTISVQEKKTSSFLSKILFSLARSAYPRATAVIAPSQGVCKDIEVKIPALKGKKIHVIHNPIRTRDIQLKSQEKLSNEELENTSYILSVGRLVPQKAFDVLIKAWAPIYHDHKIDLVILGEGSEREKLENLSKELGVSNHLHLPGFEENPFSYMASARLYVLSSYFEGLPNALLQAICCGCPVIATDCPSGPNEILQGGSLAPLVPVGDVEALQEGIDQFLKTSESNQENLWQKIETLYDPKIITEQYLTIFEQA